jgi:ribose-phosphate pyrophosphokinase
MAKETFGHQSWVISGSAHPNLGQCIAKLLNLPFTQIALIRFPDGELKPVIQKTSSRQVAIVVQSTSPPVNDHLLELLLSIEALCSAGVQAVVAVVPYLGYARQCRKDTPGEPLSAKLVLQMIECAGAKAIVTVDLHDPSIIRFAKVPVWHVRVEETLADYIKKSFPTEREPVIVAPDQGGAKRAQAVAQRLGLPIVVLEKKREKTEGHARAVIAESTVGSLEGKGAIIIDDMVTTGWTLIAAVQALRQEGADVLGAACTHGVLCSGAIDRLREIALPKLVVSDSLPVPLSPPMLDCFSIAPLLAKAIGEVLREVF